MNRVLKRIFVGKPISSHYEAQHRLSKATALAVFSSDALSSSAYATDEILLKLVLGGAAALAFSVPIGIAVIVVLTIVILSYRQTVRAYPHGGGAYTVAQDNLGEFPGLLAASALLIDYVLTVSVSVAAGIAAVGAAFPVVREERILLGVSVVLVIAALNLRGLKESGSIFAIPTYGFLFSMAVMIVFGLYKYATGTLVIPSATHVAAVEATSAWLILRAFASGSTALTGVEAISNGVPAFKKPESRNAAQTLATLGLLLSFLFFGVTFLASRVQVDPHLIEGGATVTSQIAAAIFGKGAAMFFVVQTATFLILFLAANTSFADFPRLAYILAKDRHLPHALANRGDKLAFSNGILILTASSIGVLIAYKAEVTRIIPLYVVGVFTSFTLSQTGMAIRTHRLRGAKHALLINAFGALTTFAVLIVVAVTKFKDGAWQVIVLIPTFALLLLGIGRHFRSVSRELRKISEPVDVEHPRVVLVVRRFKGATKALAFCRFTGPEQLHLAALKMPQSRLTDLVNRWESLGVPFDFERFQDTKNLISFITGLQPSERSPVTVVLPDPQYRGWISQIVRNWDLLKLKRKFLAEPGIVVVSIPFDPYNEPEPARLRSPGRVSLVIAVSAAHYATKRAIEYAKALHPSDLTAVAVQMEPGDAARLTAEWMDEEIDIPLEIVDSPFRSLAKPLLDYIRAKNPNPQDAVGVVIPEFVVSKWWHHLLHNQTAFLLKSTLLFEPNVFVINVPYSVGQPSDSPPQLVASEKN